MIEDCVQNSSRANYGNAHGANGSFRGFSDGVAGIQFTDREIGVRSRMEVSRW